MTGDGSATAGARQPDLPADARGRRARRGRVARSRPRRSTPARPTTPSTPPAGCTTRCRRGPRGSASTTIRRSRSRGCSRRASSRSRTSTSTCITATASQAIFYEDPRVLTISLHESGEYLFPGTGFVTERGVRGRRGHGRQRPAASRRDRRGVARGVPRGRAAARARVLAEGARHAARLRHARDGSARAPAADDADLPRGRGGAPRARARGRPAAGGWRPAAAATGGRTSSRARGRSRSPRWPARTLDDALPEAWIEEAELTVRREVPATFSEPVDLARPPGRRDDRHDLGGAKRRRSRSSGWRREPGCVARSSSARSAPPPRRVERVRELAEAGTDVFRINLSHGDAQDAPPAVRRGPVGRRRSAARDLAIMADLPGTEDPARRSSSDGAVRLEVGTTFELRAGGTGRRRRRRDDDLPGRSPTTSRTATASCSSDGAVELTVTGRDGTTRRDRAWCGRGRIRSGAGVNVPAERLSVPAITDRDRAGSRRRSTPGVDLVAQSFVRRRAGRRGPADADGRASGADRREDRDAPGDRATSTRSWARRTRSWSRAATSGSSCRWRTSR